MRDTSKPRCRMPASLIEHAAGHLRPGVLAAAIERRERRRHDDLDGAAPRREETSAGWDGTWPSLVAPAPLKPGALHSGAARVRPAHLHLAFLWLTPGTCSGLTRGTSRCTSATGTAASWCALCTGTPTRTSPASGSSPRATTYARGRAGRPARDDARFAGAMPKRPDLPSSERVFRSPCRAYLRAPSRGCVSASPRRLSDLCCSEAPVAQADRAAAF